MNTTFIFFASAQFIWVMCSEKILRGLTAFGGTYPPVVMAMPVESSNKSFRPLLAAGGAGVGDGAKVLGTDDGMKF